MKAVITERTITYGRNQFRVTGDGKWSVLMWGWFRPDQNVPIWQFMPIAADKVPEVARKVI